MSILDHGFSDYRWIILLRDLAWIQRWRGFPSAMHCSRSFEVLCCLSINLIATFFDKWVRFI